MKPDETTPAPEPRKPYSPPRVEEDLPLEAHSLACTQIGIKSTPFDPGGCPAGFLVS